MQQYKITDFQVGDQVYHLSNQKQIMVAISINTAQNEISCKWISNGTTQVEEFIPEELGKKDDLTPKIFVRTLS